MKEAIGDKDALRARMRRLRRALAPDAKKRADARIRAKLLASDALACARGAVALYMATPDEIDLAPLARSLGARSVPLVLPRWNGASYDLAVFDPGDPSSLRAGPMGILEPDRAHLVPPEDVAVWIVPGLAFGANGGRVGYGGGWYDRFLSRADGAAVRLGVAYSFQVLPDVPCGPHDQRLTAVVDER
jgi:5-formyltetrahydrofolate cyclo-ligase